MFLVFVIYNDYLLFRHVHASEFKILKKIVRINNTNIFVNFFHYFNNFFFRYFVNKIFRIYQIQSIFEEVNVEMKII